MGNLRTSQQFREARVGGIMPEEFAIQTARLNGRITAIIVRITGGNKVTFEQIDMRLPSGREIHYPDNLKQLMTNIRATSDAIAKYQSQGKLVDLDPDEWALGGRNSERLRS